jgi:hypothetical protein
LLASDTESTNNGNARLEKLIADLRGDVLKGQITDTKADIEDLQFRWVESLLFGVILDETLLTCVCRYGDLRDKTKALQENLSAEVDRHITAVLAAKDHTAKSLAGLKTFAAQQQL